jgi:hypothetical protein
MIRLHADAPARPIIEAAAAGVKSRRGDAAAAAPRRGDPTRGRAFAISAPA